VISFKEILEVIVEVIWWVVYWASLAEEGRELVATLEGIVVVGLEEALEGSWVVGLVVALEGEVVVCVEVPLKKLAVVGDVGKLLVTGLEVAEEV
jgi:hypothetical protein